MRVASTLLLCVLFLTGAMAATGPVSIEIRHPAEGESWNDCRETRLVDLVISGADSFDVQVLDASGQAMPGIDLLRSIDAAIVDHASWPFGNYVIHADAWNDDSDATATRMLTYAHYDDTTPPTSWARVDSDRAAIGGSWPTPVEISAWGSDDCMFQDVEFTVDGAPRAWEWYNGMFCCTVGFVLDGDGEHVIGHRGVDAAGNRGAWQNMTVRLDLTSPEVRILAPNDEPGIGSAWIGTGGATPPIVPGCSWFTIDIETGPIGLRGVWFAGDYIAEDIRWYVDGTRHPVEETSDDGRQAFLCFDGAGEHVITAEAWDLAGRPGTADIRILVLTA